MFNPQVVCFCDIPVEDLHIHIAKYGSFGLTFSKQFIAARGGAPVFYLPRGTRLRDQPRPIPDETRGLSGSDLHDALFEEVSLSDLYDRVVPTFPEVILHAMMMNGFPEHARLHELLQFFARRFFSYVKFFDESLEDNDSKNFYMEREWRVVDNVPFHLNDVRRVIIPWAYASRLRAEVPDFYGQVTFAD
jgi:abortive phage resistance protein AbiGi (putative antitoxin)